MGSGAWIRAALVIVFLMTISGVHSAALDGNFVHSGGLSWPQHTQQLTKRNAVQYCGTRLVEAVRGLCKGALFTGYHRRSDPSLTGGLINEDSQDMRQSTSNSVMDIMGSDPMSSQYSTLDTGYWDKDMDNSNSDLELLWPYNPKSLALKVLTEGKGHQRFRRNIIDECCKKSCTITDMVKYCGNQRRISLY